MPENKDVYLPKIRIEPDRLKTWERAHAAAAKKSGLGRELTFTGWVRAALDAKAAADLKP